MYGVLPYVQSRSEYIEDLIDESEGMLSYRERSPIREPVKKVEVVVKVEKPPDQLYGTNGEKLRAVRVYGSESVPPKKRVVTQTYMAKMNKILRAVGAIAATQAKIEKGIEATKKNTEAILRNMQEFHTRMVVSETRITDLQQARVDEQVQRLTTTKDFEINKENS